MQSKYKSSKAITQAASPQAPISAKSRNQIALFSTKSNSGAKMLRLDSQSEMSTVAES